MPIFHVCHYAIWAACFAHWNATKIIARMVQAGDDVQRNWINGDVAALNKTVFSNAAKKWWHEFGGPFR